MLDRTRPSLWPEALERFEEGHVFPPHIPMVRGMLETEELGSFIRVHSFHTQIRRCVLCAGYRARCWKYKDENWSVSRELSEVGAGSRGSEAVITMEWMSARREWSRLLWERLQEAPQVALKRR